jgi:plastocyanin
MRSRSVIAPLMSLGIVMIVTMLLAGCGGGGGGGGGGGSSGLELDSGLIASTVGTFAHTFLTVGTFNYHCTVQGHTMTGSVIVQGPSTGSPDHLVSIVPGAKTLGAAAFNLDSVTVGIGEKVTWTNNDLTEHTVTSE